MSKVADRIRAMNKQINQYATTRYPGMAGRKALRFIDDNFRSQSWEGTAWKPRRRREKGATRAILVKRGLLRRSFRMQAIGAAVRVYTDTKYAKVHNEGFYGSVTVSSHTRRQYGKFKASSVATRRNRTIKTESGSGIVKEHTRQMRIPRRQFMPTATRPSPTLLNDIKRQVTLDIYKLFKNG